MEKFILLNALIYLIILFIIVSAALVYVALYSRNK